MRTSKGLPWAGSWVVSCGHKGFRPTECPVDREVKVRWIVVFARRAIRTSWVSRSTELFVVRRCGQALLPGSSYLNRSEALVPRMFYPLLDSDLRWTRHPQRHFPISKHWCCTFLYWIVLRLFVPCRILSKESKWVEAQVRPIVSGRTHRLPAFVVVVPPVELLLFRLLRREKPQQRTNTASQSSEEHGGRTAHSLNFVGVKGATLRGHRHGRVSGCCLNPLK